MRNQIIKIINVIINFIGMDIKVTNFDEALVEKNSVGSGILPISVDENGVVYLLLAKEKFNPLWKEGHKWSGFEGGRKSSESITQTAIREYNEESLGVIKLQKNIAEIIKKKEYSMKLVVNIQQDKICSKFHITYLIAVPWQTNCINDFDNLRNMLLSVQNLGSCLEKLKSDKIYAINENSSIGFVVSVKNVETICDKTCVTYIVKKDNIYVKKKIVHEYIQNATMWHKVRSFLTFLMSKISHNSIIVSYDYSSIVYRVNIIEDYLEKEKMKWWDLETLKKILKNGGSYEQETMKSLFMPVLQCVINAI